ncbi:MAG: DUF1622 domain-containing protein [Leptolyngbya sp. SIO1E4]|nr:DUF1622 domain-containing protein [Leptolyngbya sp. SIO1E4]
MALIEHLEGNLAVFVAFAELVLEAISILCVVIGLVKTIQLILALRRRHRNREAFPFNQVRLRFGSWLALALECQLGADVLATTVAPTLEALGKLAIVALIRTFLNFFLNKELEAELKFENQRYEQKLLFTEEGE